MNEQFFPGTNIFQSLMNLIFNLPLCFASLCFVLDFVKQDQKLTQT